MYLCYAQLIGEHFPMEHDDILEFINNAKINNLRSIDPSNRDITEIPHEIGKLTDLEYLDFSYNKISNLPLKLGTSLT